MEEQRFKNRQLNLAISGPNGGPSPLGEITTADVPGLTNCAIIAELSRQG